MAHPRPRSRELPTVARTVRATVVLTALFPWIVAGCSGPDTAPGDEATAAPPAAAEVEAWEARAAGVTIVRDEWGIPHVYGATDADAVFGMIYAQAEDDFNRIEINFLNSQGRLAEAEGESEIWRDLRMKMFIDPDEMRALYDSSPGWLRDLMDAWADGLNYFLHTHPDVRPRVLTRFEPWMALTFSEGSIGGDIESIRLSGLEALYGGPEGALGRAASLGVGSAGEAAAVGDARAELAGFVAEPAGSNGFAIAPANSATGNALLLINPHTSFYFRAEVHMASDEGLNAYGAVTWGQFFVYQGFNETAGWMHTSTGADMLDEFAYEVDVREDGVYYAYGDEERRMVEKTITVPYRRGRGMAERTFTVYESHEGPVVRSEGDRWIAVHLMEEPVDALIQSYTRTKAADYDEYKQIMELHTNSSNNTVFADAEGNIAYFHANFVPVRDPGFDWSQPVDGNDPATAWQGLHSVDGSPLVVNPPTGWIQNTNNWPYSAAGEFSPREADYPPYMDRAGENMRGLHALRVLEGATDVTLQGLIDRAYDSYLTGFDPVIPALTAAYDGAAADHPAKVRAGDDLSDTVELLRGWDRRFGVESVATSVAITYGDQLWSDVGDAARAAGVSVYDYMAEHASRDEHLLALSGALERLAADFGTWRTAWGEINRFQRLTGDIVQPFDDDAPSIPVGFATSRWGSLAAYGQRTFNDTRRRYGTRGNSFVAVVEFGDSLRARAITAGGQSGDPASPHFDDQAERYATGDLRPVRFYRADVDAHAEETYRPGRR